MSAVRYIGLLWRARYIFLARIYLHRHMCIKYFCHISFGTFDVCSRDSRQNPQRISNLLCPELRSRLLLLSLCFKREIGEWRSKNMDRYHCTRQRNTLSRLFFHRVTMLGKKLPERNLLLIKRTRGEWRWFASVFMVWWNLDLNIWSDASKECNLPEITILNPLFSIPQGKCYFHLRMAALSALMCPLEPVGDISISRSTVMVINYHLMNLFLKKSPSGQPLWKDLHCQTDLT